MRADIADNPVCPPDKRTGGGPIGRMATRRVGPGHVGFDSVIGILIRRKTRHIGI